MNMCLVKWRRLFSASSIALANYGEPMLTQMKTQVVNVNVNVRPRVSLIEANSKLRELVKTGKLGDTRKMFDEMPHRDEISWTTIISGYVNAMKVTEALALFSSMWIDRCLRMDPFILSLAFKACGLDMNVSFGDSLHGYSVKTGLVNSVFVGSALLDMYTKTGRIALGCKVFDEMPLRNVVTWTAVITGLVKAGYCMEGLMCFSEMWMSKVQCDTYTYAIALKACADMGVLRTGREIHTHTVKKGFDASSYVVNTLAAMYIKCGRLDYGLRLFERMPTQDVVSWTTIITMYVQMGKGESAIQAFSRMRESDVIPNEYTFAAVISACASLAKIRLGEQLHADVLCKGLLESLSVMNALMTLYSKCGQLNLASGIFQEMTWRDVVSWSTIIAAYSQGGHGEEAFGLLSMMRREGPKPTEFALASVLSACGNMAILEQGKQLHAHVLCIGLENTPMVQSALINMYAKCGSIREASKIFDASTNDDIVSWTAMINGYAEHGHSHEAIDLFEKLSYFGLRPDPVAYIGVLTACSHAGLVDLGYYYFQKMSMEHQISPSKEHYGCMIDLLCRDGQLDKAERMIESMPFERDDVVWSTMLRACRVHGDVDRGKRIADYILDLDPNCAGTYITLCNIYSSKGRWREAADVRKLMKSKGVIKDPGWSLIKVENFVLTFVASDTTHIQSDDMYNILDVLASGDVGSEETSLLFDMY